jgi:hypothetical protein
MTAPFGLFRLLTPALSPASPQPKARHRGAPEKKRGGLGNDMMSRKLSSAAEAKKVLGLIDARSKHKNG